MDKLTIDDQKKMWQKRELLKIFGAQKDFKTPSLRKMNRRIDDLEKKLERLEIRVARNWDCIIF